MFVGSNIQVWILIRPAVFCFERLYKPWPAMARGPLGVVPIFGCPIHILSEEPFMGKAVMIQKQSSCFANANLTLSCHI